VSSIIAIVRGGQANGRAAWATWKVGPPSRSDDPTRSTRAQEDEELAR